MRYSERELFYNDTYTVDTFTKLHRPSVYHVGLYHIIVSDISLKTRCFGLHFCRKKFRYVFNHFYAVLPGSYRM